MHTFKIIHGSNISVFDVHTIEQLSFPGEIIYFGYWSDITPCCNNDTVCLWHIKWKSGKTG